jgi:trimethylamine:corrinoid methyltransferase-like protein
MAARALNPSVGLGGSMWAGTIDARTGAVSYSATDAMSYAVATVAFLRLWAGVRIAVGAGDYCDAREPGLYAALEKAYKSMTVTACTGQPWAAGTGLLDEGRTISPVQLLLDRELSGSAAWLARGFDVEAVEAGVQAAVEIGLGFGSNHLASGHTARHFRNSLWLPRYADRRGWTREADEAAVRRAQADIDRMVAEYRKPADRDGVLGRVRGVIDRARRVLL